MLSDHESDDEKISYNPTTQALLMANKRENRFNHKKTFNSFVLHQKSQNDNEFNEFLALLKENANRIPAGTRIQLAVLTSYISEDIDPILYQQGHRTSAHWTAIDLLIGENGIVSSFVLDAANGAGHLKMHDKLKENFTNGKHYIYQADFPNGIERRIQTQSTGCDVFTAQHLNQLSRIDSDTLYNGNLPKVSDTEGKVKAENFIKQLKLNVIFRGMQTRKGFYALDEEALQTTITTNRDGKSITLKETGDEAFKNQGYNQTNQKKAAIYKKRKSDYVESLTETNRNQIIGQRQGFSLLKNPILFSFSKILAKLNQDNLFTFIELLSKELQKLTDNNNSIIEPKHFKKINETIQQLQALSTTQDPINSGKIKNEILLNIESLYKHFDDNQIENEKILNPILSQSISTMPIYLILNGLKKLDSNNYHGGIKKISTIASSINLDDLNFESLTNAWGKIQEECEFRTKKFSSMGGYLSNSIFHKLSPRDEAADLLYWAVKQYKQNIALYPDISSIDDLIGAQQKRDAILVIDKKMESLSGSRLLLKTILTEFRKLPNDFSEAHLRSIGKETSLSFEKIMKIKDFHEIIKKIVNSKASESLADIFNLDPYKNNHEEIFNNFRNTKQPDQLLEKLSKQENLKTSTYK